jgi:hypothetical protein
MGWLTHPRKTAYNRTTFRMGRKRASGCAVLLIFAVFALTLAPTIRAATAQALVRRPLQPLHRTVIHFPVFRDLIHGWSNIGSNWLGTEIDRARGTLELLLTAHAR